MHSFTKYLAKASWLHFILLAIFIISCSTSLGLNRPSDGLKSFAWLLLLGSGAIWLDSKLWLGKNRIWLFFTVVFIFDLAVQGVVRKFFGATPSPSVIAQALTNTNAGESFDFILEQARHIGFSVAFLLLGFIGVLLFNRYSLSAFQRALSSLNYLSVVVWGFMTTLLHFNPTMLRQEPFLRWAVVVYRHVEAQNEIQQIQSIQQQILTTKSTWNVTTEDNNDRTVVLIIGESANRHNWGKYGYARATTLPLEDTLNSLSGQTVWFTQAKSTAAFTLPSLERALTPASIHTPDDWKTSPDILMLAKAAGYQVTWLSNQPGNDGWIASLGKNADSQAFINNGNWRDSSATDLDLLPQFQKHLSLPAPKKELIVLHLLGQHFHYELRCPPNIKPYEGVEDDEVMRLMKSEGRSNSIRKTRNEYDNAVYCGSVFLSEVLKQLNEKRPNRNISFVYFSDHGQEVGHTQNFAGHSEASQNGYDIPLFIWDKQSNPNTNSLYEKPFSLDDLDHLLHGVLGINSNFYKSNLDPKNETSYPNP
jgi:heptose-I-phosphate ethanolaminephosphotransferase